MKLNNIQSIAVGLLTFFFGNYVSADSLSDLQQTLTRLNGSHPVSGELDMFFTETRDKGKDKKIKVGKIKTILSESSKGLDIHYSKQILAKVAQENHIKMIDENAETPTLNGAEILSASSLIPIISSAQTILDYIDKGEFKGESYIEYLGQKTRILKFSLPLESFIDDKKFRSYVNKFSGSYQVLINEEGTPIETRMSYSGKGSAYIFFSMKAEGEIISQFNITGTRLVRINRTQKSTSSSTFSDRIYNATWKFNLF